MENAYFFWLAGFSIFSGLDTIQKAELALILRGCQLA